MGLSNDIISQFVKITNDAQKKVKKDTITYGEVSKKDGDLVYVILDGTSPDNNGKKAEVPASTTVNVSTGDRVIIMIKNHSAVITGNMGNPATNRAYVDEATGEIVHVVQEASNKATEAANKVTEFGVALGQKLDVSEFTAKMAAVENLEADSLLSQTVKANEASVEELTADNAEIKGKLEANEAAIESLQAGSLTVEEARAEFATIENLEATDAEVDNLKSTHANFESATAKNFEAVDASITELNTKKLDAESAKIIYANIDFSNIGKAAIEEFFSKSGMITDLVVGDGTITGELVGVTISGDLIKGNTVKADKLVVKGSDGLYYKLNIEAGATTSTEVTETDLQNGLHGTAIIAKTITAEKISVSDLVAFGADIAGFHITKQNTFYSGAKSSVSNTTQGIYLDATGQMNVGDASNFIKYYKATDGSYKLEISASSVLLGAGKKSVETAIGEVQSSVDNIQVGAENLYVKSASFDSDKWINTAGWTKDGTDSNGNARIKHGTWAGLYQFIKVKAGDVYTLSANVSGDGVADFRFYGSLYSEPSVDSTVILGVTPAHSDRGLAPLNEQRFRQVYTITEDGYLRVCIENGISDSYIWISSMKLERGNKSTDWSPNPSDMATSDEVNLAQATAEEAESKASNAQTLIAQLSDSISMLVTDGNGTSLMTQTEDGWTFSTATIQDLVNKVSDNLNTLTEDVGGVSGTVELIKQSVNDLEEIAEYVNITTYEDEPCIELGEADSDFKLRITNTRMMFTEGSTVLAYFTNQAFNSKKVVIEEELQQGGFVWKVRSNGNLGLTWKGGNS